MFAAQRFKKDSRTLKRKNTNRSKKEYFCDGLVRKK